MADKTDEIMELLTRYLRDELSSKDQERLTDWLNESKNNRQYFEKISDADFFNEHMKEYFRCRDQFEERRLNDTYATIKSLNEKRYVRYWHVAAASIILFISVGIFYFLINSRSQKTIPGAQVVSKTITRDIAPGGNKAVLTLGDQTEIILDEAKSGSLAQQGNTLITKQEGLLTYKAEKTNNKKEVLYNTISTPRGGQFHVILPDGSHAWLNAASSIHFPTQFADAERKIELKGEAYFEVTKDAKRPFKVYLSGSRRGVVEVLGTHFNAMAYEDEENSKITLLEGKVTVSNDIGKKLLAPGQEADLIQNGNPTIINDVDVDKAIAWKNGYFQFQKDNISTVMRTIARWYDISIVYSNGMPNNLITGKIYRNTNLSTVVKILSSLSVNCEIDGKKLIVGMSK